MDNVILVIIPLLISGAIGFAGWGWHMPTRLIQLMCRILTIWCLMIIPILIFRNWIWGHLELVGYIVLPFAIVAIAFLWEKVSITLKGRYQSSVGLTKEQQGLVDFYERQKTNWEQYIIFQLINVVCYTKAKTPHLIFHVKVYNFHPVSFKIVKIKADGTLNRSGEVGNLPSIKDDEKRDFRECGEGLFAIKIDINGTGLPAMLETAAEKRELVQWIIQGQWEIEIYGKTQEWRHPPSLMVSNIPQLLASN